MQGADQDQTRRRMEAALRMDDPIEAAKEISEILVMNPEDAGILYSVETGRHPGGDVIGDDQGDG